MPRLRCRFEEGLVQERAEGDKNTKAFTLTETCRSTDANWQSASSELDKDAIENFRIGLRSRQEYPQAEKHREAATAHMLLL